MIVISLYELQEMVRTLCERKHYSKSPTTLALGMSEEVGEIASNILRVYTADYTISEHNRNKKVPSAKDTAYEVGDLITYTLALCNAIGIEPAFRWMSKGE